MDTGDLERALKTFQHMLAIEKFMGGKVKYFGDTALINIEDLAKAIKRVEKNDR